jgi:hypothetical protein
MNYTELLQSLNLSGREIIATIIKPVRNEEEYKQGRVIGFKPGIRGGGHSDYSKDSQDRDGYRGSHPHSFSSLDIRWIKKPKVLIVYSVIDFMRGKEHWDWIEVDNCTFEIKETL